jgi:hypothetical protein
MNLNQVMRSWSRAFAAQFRFKILILSIFPLIISVLLWGGLMWWRLQSIIDFVQTYLTNHNGFTTAGELLSALGLLALKTLVVPLLSMWFLLPAMVMSSLLLIALVVMPTISAHVGKRDFPHLERRFGGSFLGSLGFALSSFVLFTIAWFASLPLLFFPPVYVFVQPLLWGWLSYRIMSYDALAAYADAEERSTIFTTHKVPLILIGTIAGWFGTLPSALWLGGAMSFAYVLFFPVFICLAIWLCLVIFIFTGCWYQYYCLSALHALRQSRETSIVVLENEAV